MEVIWQEMKRRTKKIKIPLYYQRLKIVVSEVLDKPQHEAYVEYVGDTIEVHIKPNATPGLIAHEALHIVHHVFIECLIEPDMYNDEPQAYLLGWVVDKISKDISQFIKK